jgi:hypothetical protein
MVEMTTMEKREEAGYGEGLAFEMDQVSFYEAIHAFTDVGIEEVLMTGANDGVRIANMNPQHTTLIVEYIDAKRCTKYSKGDAAFGVTLSDLKGVLTHIKGKLKFSQKGDRITMTGADGFTKTFTVSGDQIVVPIPKIDYRNGGVVNGKQLYTAVSVAADMADYVNFTADGSNVIVSAKRDEKNEMEMPVKILKGNFKGEEGIKATYNSEMVKNLIKPLKSGDVMVRFVVTAEEQTTKSENNKTKKVVAEQKTAGPLKINFKIGENGNDDVRGYALLAPIAP